MPTPISTTIRRAFWAFVFITVAGTSIFVWLGFRSSSSLFFLQAVGCVVMGGVNALALQLLLSHQTAQKPLKKYTKPVLILGWCIGFVLLGFGFMVRLLN